MRYYSSENFLQSITSADDYLYIFLAKSSEWENDAERDTPLVDSNTLDNEGWRDILCMKRIMPSDCFRVINVYDWETGKIYSEYDDSKELDKLSPAYYVLNGTNVYKCISNNSGSQSVTAPTGQTTSGMIKNDSATQDGYVWKITNPSGGQGNDRGGCFGPKSLSLLNCTPWGGSPQNYQGS